MNKLEALADALSYYHQAYNPESQAYKNRNPGMLIAISMRHQRDKQNKRIFTSYLDGYQALLFDLKIKCSGQSNANLPDAPTLFDLMKTYGQMNKMAAKLVAKFLTKALNEEVTFATPLVYFLEK